MTEDRGVVDGLWQKSIGVVGLDAPESRDDRGVARVLSRHPYTPDHEIRARPGLVLAEGWKIALGEVFYFSMAACICFVPAFGRAQGRNSDRK